MVCFNTLDFIVHRNWYADHPHFGKHILVCDTCSVQKHDLIVLKYPLIHKLIHPHHIIYNSYGGGYPAMYKPCVVCGKLPDVNKKPSDAICHKGECYCKLCNERYYTYLYFKKIVDW